MVFQGKRIKSQTIKRCIQTSHSSFYKNIIIYQRGKLQSSRVEKQVTLPIVMELNISCSKSKRQTINLSLQAKRLELT